MGFDEGGWVAVLDTVVLAPTVASDPGCDPGFDPGADVDAELGTGPGTVTETVVVGESVEVVIEGEVTGV